MATNTTATTAELANASASVTDGFASSTGLGPVVGVVLVAAVGVMGVSYAASAAERYERLYRVVEAIGQGLRYAVTGTLSVLALATVAAPVYLFGQLEGETQTWIAEVALVAVVAVAVLAVIGYAVEEYVLPPLREHHREVVGAPEEVAENVD